MENNVLALEIYQEETPNPESWKFNTNLHLLPNYYAEFKSGDECGESDLAKRLFDIPFMQSVFISNNFITITKKKDYEWYEIAPEIKDVIRKFIVAGGKVVSDNLLRKGEAPKAEPSDNPEEKIKELLDISDDIQLNEYKLMSSFLLLEIINIYNNYNKLLLYSKQLVEEFPTIIKEKDKKLVKIDKELIMLNNDELSFKFNSNINFMFIIIIIKIIYNAEWIFFTI